MQTEEILKAKHFDELVGYLLTMQQQLDAQTGEVDRLTTKGRDLQNSVDQLTREMQELQGLVRKWRSR